MFTGQWPDKLSTGWYDPLDESYPVLAEVFRSSGYQTAGFVANREYCSRELGLGRGFDHYEDYQFTLGQLAMSEALTSKIIEEANIQRKFGTNRNFGRKSAQQLNDDFLTWFSKVNKEKPFFVFLNYYDAHDPYLPPDDFATIYAPEIPFGHLTSEIIQQHPPDLVRQLKDAYESAITYLDQQVGRLFEVLASLIALENTLVIITSDHGEEFGEHNLVGHGNSQYLELIHVPLMIIFPGKIPRRKIVEVPVTLRNLAATILDLVDIQNPGIFPGRSLERYWNGSQEEEMLYSHLYIGPGLFNRSIYAGEIESLYYDNLHYIQGTGGFNELYDVKSDPNELTNLADDPAYSDTLKKYRDYLRSTKQ